MHQPARQILISSAFALATLFTGVAAAEEFLPGPAQVVIHGEPGTTVEIRMEDGSVLTEVDVRGIIPDTGGITFESRALWHNQTYRLMCTNAAGIFTKMFKLEFFTPTIVPCPGHISAR